jgi:hypothetical protein
VRRHCFGIDVETAKSGRCGDGLRSLMMTARRMQIC